MTLTREGDFIGSEDDTVEEINIFDGQDNRITFEQVGTNQALDSILRLQVYTKTFKCTYQLQLYPFDTQVCHQTIWNFWCFVFGLPLMEIIVARMQSSMSPTQVCTVNLIVRKLETSVMAITPNILNMDSQTVLTQYIITNWFFVNFAKWK